MIKVGLPPDSVKAKMQIEGVDPSILDNNPDAMVPEAASSSSQKVALKDHPTYAKFFKMIKNGVPIDAVRLKMRAEGVDVTFIDKSPDDLLALETEMEQMVTLMDHPIYGKYFRMLKVGLPKDAVKSKMKQEGANDSFLDKEPTDLVPLTAKAPTAASMKKVMGPAVRKKKLYWKAVDASKIGADSIWNTKNGEEDADNVEILKEEFEQLFVEQPSAAAKDKKPEKPVEQKKVKVNLIDAKRAQNAGIALARIKKSFDLVRKAVADMDEKEFSTEQLKSLGEYLPNDEESRVLKAFSGDLSQLGQAERYMLTMLGFQTAKKRLDCMVFKQQFNEKLNEIRGTVAAIDKACEQVKSSTRMKKVLKCILKVGNQMNDGAANIGFSLDSLLKLQAAKAFDKKTSVLQYVIMLIFRNDEACLNFPDDLEAVGEASRLMLDQVEGDRVTLQRGLDDSCKAFAEIQKDTSIDASEDSTRNQAAMTTFLNRAKRDCEALDLSLKQLKEKYASLLNYFGEEESLQSHEFFDTISKFVMEFSSTRDALEKARKAEEKKKKEAEAKAARAATIPVKGASSTAPATASSSSSKIAPPKPNGTPAKPTNGLPAKPPKPPNGLSPKPGAPESGGTVIQGGLLGNVVLKPSRRGSSIT